MAGITIVTFTSVLTFVWNFWAAKHRIKESVNSEIEKFKDKFNEEKADLLKRNDELSDKLVKETNRLSGDMARSFALINEDKKYLVNSSNWWAIAIYHYSEIDKNDLLKISIDALLDILRNPEWKKQVEAGDLDKTDYEKIKLNVKAIANFVQRKRRN